MTTLVPTGPLVGLNDVIVGTTKKFIELVAAPPDVVTQPGRSLPPPAPSR